METVNVLSVRNISHSELKEWIQKYISPKLKDIGELGTGIEFCLGTFILFPNTISLKKIRVGGLSQYDKYHNFKCLQAAFNDLDLNKVIPMEEMMKMTFRDNFYFGCWFKMFFESNYNGDPYDIQNLHSQCKIKHTKMICECLPPRTKSKKHPLKFNINLKASMQHFYQTMIYPNNEVSVKLMPKTVFVGRTKRQILELDGSRGRKSSLGKLTQISRQERPNIPEETKIHQLCLPSSKSKDSKTVKEAMACKSDTDFATKKRKCPPLTGGCANQADLCRSLNVAMSQIRKALITIRSGLYQKVTDDWDKRHKEQSEAGKHLNSIEYYDQF